MKNTMAVSELSSNLTCGDLKIEQSCLLLKSSINYGTVFKYQNLECEKCDLVQSKHVPPYEVKPLVLNFVSFGTAWKIENKENETICRNENMVFNEKSLYSLFINESGCSVIENEKVSSPYIPLLVAVFVYFIIGLLWVSCRYFYRRKIWERLVNSRTSLDELAAAYSTSSTVEDTKQRQVKQRLRSLDTVRGIAIVVMIFVNYGGGQYWFFNHATWNGLTIADLVFPWFIWMMGMSLALSLRSLLRKAIPRRTIFWKILKRSIILFALGIMLNTYCTVVDLKSLRISGVLQRFSISYFVVASIHLFFAQTEDNQQQSRCTHFEDIFVYWAEWLIMIIFLILHILITFFVHDTECPAGYLGPGGLHDGGKFSFCTGGAAGYIDRKILGVNHLYNAYSVKAIYHNTLSYDPEGILGYLTSIFLVFLGLQAGKILLAYSTPNARISRWLGWSAFIGIMALILCKASKNDGWIPVNKNLWSVSFIFATGSLAFLLISICYFLIDVKKWWSGAPFFYCGMNSILLYVGHEITHKMFPWSWQVPSNHYDELALNLWGTSLWVIISIWTYHMKFFITI